MGRVANEQQAQTAVRNGGNDAGRHGVVNNLEIKATAKKDFAVEPTAHTNGSARRTTSRDDLAFGGATSKPGAVAPLRCSKPLRPDARVSYNAGIGHHHGARVQRRQCRRIRLGPGHEPSGYNTGAPIPVGGSSTQGGGNASPTISRTCRATLGRATPRYPNYGARDVPEAILGFGLAVHRSVLSVPASAARLAQGDDGMERRLVVRSTSTTTAGTSAAKSLRRS